jgi:O-antigen/teichoic acid export membrane protein
MVATMRCRAGTLLDATVAAPVSAPDPALDDPPVAARPRLRETISRSESGKAAGLAAATLANNAIQLVFTVVFTRLLGATGYGTLAALISAFLILLVAGQSMQAAAAREAALDRLGHPEVLRATLSAWMRRLLLVLVVVSVISALLRQPLAALIAVPDVPWAAAAIPPTGVLWMLLCLQRGTLQGLRRYQPVAHSIIGEAAGRLVFGLLLVAIGLDVTGAFLGTPLAFVVVALWLERELHRAVGPVRPIEGAVRTLRSVAGDGWAPIVGLVCLASLQNIDVIMAKHQLSGDDAGSYAAAAVAAKAVVWVAIGVGLHLLPEATRRAAAGLSPRPVLLRALGIVSVVAGPALLVFAVAPKLLLRLAFGPDLTAGADALFVLGAAMTLLAVTFLTVQYLLALHRTSFLWALGAVAVAEPILLASAGTSIVGFAKIVLGLQVAAAVAVLAFAAAAGRPRA